MTCKDLTQTDCLMSSLFFFFSYFIFFIIQLFFLTSVVIHPCKLALVVSEVSVKWKIKKKSLFFP